MAQVLLLYLLLIDDYTLTTAESFDNLLGSNNFSCEWTSYFFYDRRGNLSLTTSGYCFKNWPTDDILLAFNQNKELFVTECCFVEELKMFGLSENTEESDQDQMRLLLFKSENEYICSVIHVYFMYHKSCSVMNIYVA